MKLRFFARGAGLVSLPGAMRYVGQAPRYIGREAQSGAFPATAEPFECDPDSAIGKRLCRLTRLDAALWPADATTAAACGVEFVRTRFADGEHVPDTQPAPAKAREGKKDEKLDG